MTFGDFQEIANHLSDNARLSLQNADAVARSVGSAYIGTEHILLGVLGQSSSMGAKILGDQGIDFDRARTALNVTPKALVVSTGAKGLSETAKLTLKLSWDIAQEFSQDYCGTEHILYSIISQKNARATILLRDMNVDIDHLVGEIEQYLNRQQADYDNSNSATKPKKRGRRQTILDFYGTDLTDQAKDNELDPVIGRDEQIKRMITILGRRSKNNPVLIGEPGVGKTAIVEGLAQRIASGDVPDHLAEKRVVMLDLAGMIAGTKYRGEFEERLKKLIDEITNDENMIVFIDELHLLVGAGSAEGSIDAANMLKPALARGKIRLIGATTLDEYRKNIEKDSALERRLQTVTVPESTLKDTIQILKGLKVKYEKYHGVSINDETIQDIAYLAKRYINDRFMPDKAIDVLDETAAEVKVERGRVSPELKKLNAEQKILNSRMEDAVEAEDYERAAYFKQRLSQIGEDIEEIKQKDDSQQKLELTSDDVARTIATMTGVPVQKVIKSEVKYLINLEKHLAKSIIGQTDAVNAVAKAIRRNRSGIGESGRPIGSFMFMGPTGVGKTELARVIARELFGSEDALIKIDMSEFAERHTTARLVGAPAGYVGYEDAGQLTDKVRRRPYSLVLFDEIEKAHPEVFNILLQIMEDGRLTDAKGRAVDFTNTVVILTSNLGAEKMQREATLGFRAISKEQLENLENLHQQNTEAAMEDLRSMMRPELINRLDKIVVFNALTKKEINKILELQIDRLNKRLMRKFVAVKLSQSAKNYVLEKGYDPLNGVRPLRRALQEGIEDEIADGLLDGRYSKGDVIKVSAAKDKLTFKVEKE